ncbi:MAG: hypothetical protein ACI9OD_000095 [Limisphaerales bacterium]|jgi:hypothetical protein
MNKYFCSITKIRPQQTIVVKTKISGLTPWPEQFLRRMGLFLFPEVLDHLADVLDVFE